MVAYDASALGIYARNEASLPIYIPTCLVVLKGRYSQYDTRKNIVKVGGKSQSLFLLSKNLFIC